MPVVEARERVEVASLGEGFFRVVARYGFMEKPSVPEIMHGARDKGVYTEEQTTTYFLGRETLLPKGISRMAPWRKHLFALMSRNAWNASLFFDIPPGRVIELGMQVEL